MGAWHEDKLQTLRFIDNEHTMFNKLSGWVNELGFDFCGLGIRSPLPVSNPVTFAMSNYPDDWQLAYQRNNYLRIDPTVLHSMRSQEMIVWSDELFAETPDFWRAAQAAGLRHGLSQPTHGSHGIVGIMSLARSAGTISAAELDDKKFKLAWLAQIAHQGMAKHLVSNFMPTLEAKLSIRERSVLRWTADGKTSENIAEILLISERTVNFHINNAVAKLGTTNRTAAVVQAALLGLL